MASKWIDFLLFEFREHDYEQDKYSCTKVLVFEYCKNNSVFILLSVLTFLLLFVSIYILSSVLKSVFIVNNRSIKFYLYFWLFSTFSFLFQLLSVFIKFKHLYYMYHFLTWSPFLFCGMAQLIFDFLLLKLYTNISLKTPFVGYSLMIIAIFVMINVMILCFSLDFFIIQLNQNQVNFLYFMETLIHITSTYCFFRTFFFNNSISLFFSRKKIFIFKSLTFLSVSIFIGNVIICVLFFDGLFYIYFDAYKPKLFFLLENLSIFSYFFLSIFQISISAVSVIILNDEDSENLKEKDDQYSPNCQLEMSLADY